MGVKILLQLQKCGCEDPAPIAKMTSRRFGHVKGDEVVSAKSYYKHLTALRAMVRDL